MCQIEDFEVDVRGLALACRPRPELCHDPVEQRRVLAGVLVIVELRQIGEEFGIRRLDGAEQFGRFPRRLPSRVTLAALRGEDVEPPAQAHGHGGTGRMTGRRTEQRRPQPAYATGDPARVVLARTGVDDDDARPQIQLPGQSTGSAYI